MLQKKDAWNPIVKNQSAKELEDEKVVSIITRRLYDRHTGRLFFRQKRGTERGTKSEDFATNVFKADLASSEYDDLFYKTADNIINSSKILKLTNNN